MSISFYGDKALTVLKIAILGQPCVGKTTLLRRINNKYVDEEEVGPTIGTDVLTKSFYKDGTDYILQYWDTAGQERYQSIVSNMLRELHCVIFVYDINRPETISKFMSWLKVVKDKNADDENIEFEDSGTQTKHKCKIPFVILGNKLDLIDTETIKNENIEYIYNDDSNNGIEYVPYMLRKYLFVEFNHRTVHNDLLKKRPTNDKPFSKVLGNNESMTESSLEGNGVIFYHNWISAKNNVRIGNLHDTIVKIIEYCSPSHMNSTTNSIKLGTDMGKQYENRKCCDY